MIGEAENRAGIRGPGSDDGTPPRTDFGLMVRLVIYFFAIFRIA
jgi:hypothetical protein